MQNNKVRSIYRDSDGDMWIGTKMGGMLSKFNLNDFSFTNYKHNPNDPLSISDDYILCITEDRPGFIWVGTLRGGLNLFDKKRGKVIVYKNNPDDQNSIADNGGIFVIFKNDDGKLWIGGNTPCLDVFDPINMTFKHYSKGTNNFFSGAARVIIKDKGGVIWIGTTKGLVKYNKETDDFSSYVNDSKNHTSISNNDIYCICEDSSERFWIGTKYGLNLMNRKEGKFTVFSTKNGLPSNAITGILEDRHGNLWLSTLNGLSKFNPVTYKFRNYTIEDGLQSNEFPPYVQCCKTNTGEMLFGGNYGFNLFDPDKITDNPIIPKVYFTNFFISNNPVPIADKNSVLQKHISHSSTISLDHTQTTFSIEYVALSYTSPEKNIYAYKMDGLEKNWNYVGAKRMATYNYLDAGKYTFRVKAANSDGVWNETSTSIQIIILPPWWKTWWAYIFYIIVLTSVLLFFRYYSIARYRLKVALNAERIEAKRILELNKMKLQFFTNIAHEFRTPLTLISGPIDYFLELQTKWHSEKDKKYLAMMKRNVDRLLLLINNVMDIRKVNSGLMYISVKNDDIIRFVKSIANTFNFKAERKNITYKTIFEPTSYNGWFDSEVIDKIVFNLLSNAFKFTPDNGEISIVTTIVSGESGDLVRIIVKENGVGISKEHQDKIFDQFYQADNQMGNVSGSGIGLALVKELVVLMKGTINLESETGRGSSFTVTLPVGNEILKFGEHSSKINTQVEPEIECPEISLETKQLSTGNSKEKQLILIVEDDLDMLMYISNILQEKYTTICANNGRSGITLAIEHVPDVIVSDIMMPEINGLEMCKILRTDERTSHIPVIMLTAKTTEQNQIDGLQIGADEYITKPFNAKILQLKIRNIFESRHRLHKRFANEINIKPSEITMNQRDEQFISHAVELIDKNLSNADYQIGDLARDIGMEQSGLHKKLKALVNESPGDFIRIVRLKKATQLLITGNFTVSEVAYQVSFNDPKYFGKVFKKQLGKTPSDFFPN